MLKGVSTELSSLQSRKSTHFYTFMSYCDFYCVFRSVSATNEFHNIDSTSHIRKMNRICNYVARDKQQAISNCASKKFIFTKCDIFFIDMNVISHFSEPLLNSAMIDKLDVKGAFTICVSAEDISKGRALPTNFSLLTRI